MLLQVRDVNTNIFFSVDCVIFGLDESKLKVLLIKHAWEPALGSWALPGGLVEQQETLEQAAHRLLEQLTGVKEVFTEQVRTFSEVNRFPNQRVITTAMYALIKPEKISPNPNWYATEAAWYDVDQVPELAFDHNRILESTLAILQREIRLKPIGFDLLPEKFTLGDLQRLFEVVLSKKLDRRNFRRKVQSMDILTQLNEKRKGPHAPAQLFQFNEQAVEEAKEQGFLIRI